MPTFRLSKVRAPARLSGFGRLRLVPPDPQTRARYSAFFKPKIDVTTISSFLAAAFGVSEGDEVCFVLINDATSEAHELRLTIDRIEPRYPDLQFVVSCDQLLSQFDLVSDGTDSFEICAKDGTCFQFQTSSTSP